MDLPGVVEIYETSLAASVLTSIYLLCSKTNSISFRLLIYLSLCDLLASLFYVINAKLPPTPKTCPALVIFFNLFSNAASIWTCIIAFHLVWKAERRKSSVLLECIYMLVAFGIPIVLDIMFFVVEYNKHTT